VHMATHSCTHLGLGFEAQSVDELAVFSFANTERDSSTSRSECRQAWDPAYRGGLTQPDRCMAVTSVVILMTDKSACAECQAA
jgi:hypothetical protein